MTKIWFISNVFLKFICRLTRAGSSPSLTRKFSSLSVCHTWYYLKMISPGQSDFFAVPLNHEAWTLHAQTPTLRHWNSNSSRFFCRNDRVKQIHVAFYIRSWDSWPFLIMDCIFASLSKALWSGKSLGKGCGTRIIYKIPLNKAVELNENSFKFSMRIERQWKEEKQAFGQIIAYNWIERTISFLTTFLFTHRTKLCPVFIFFYRILFVGENVIRWLKIRLVGTFLSIVNVVIKSLAR